jgi:hypothetical protein
MTGWKGLLLHHLGPFLGAINITILCAFVCIVDRIDAQIGRLYYTSREFDLFASLRKCN